MVAVNWLWCNDLRCFYSVIVNDVLTDFDKVRKKLLILEALANLLFGKPENEIVVKGKKKQATANFWKNCGIMILVKLIVGINVTER